MIAFVQILFVQRDAAAWENMMSIMDTCRKHGISLYDYIKDIFSGKKEMTRLSTLIAQKASMKPT